MNVEEFDFDLPAELIAQQPLPERSSSRLLYYNRNRKAFDHRTFTEIAEILDENCVLVLNNSRVLRARIPIENAEIFLLEPLLEKPQNWKCLVRKSKTFPVGKEISFPDGTTLTIMTVYPNGTRAVHFKTENFSEFLEKYGEMPIPPYIHEKLSDADRYQTVYAKENGSVAAPTAGLHFTPDLLEKLQKKGVQIEYVTLHVGLGTFLPVKSTAVEAHVMHSESFFLAPEVATRLSSAKQAGKKIIAVGSTALRTLETCARRSVQAGQLHSGSGKTNLFLYPPASFGFVDGLLTNFHLPKSTLIMLVAAFLAPGTFEGIETVKKLYREAVNKEYRFFSFGDAMLIL